MKSTVLQSLVLFAFVSSCYLCDAAETRQGKELLVFAKENNSEGVSKLLEQGISSNLADSSGVTPLHLATANNDFDLMRILIEHKANVNARTHRGRSVLFEAAYSKEDTKAVQFLLDAGSKPDLPTIDHACMLQHNETLRLLVEAGGDPNVALAYAAFHGNTSVIEYLLKKGAQVDAYLNSSSTPLHVAVYEGNLQAVKILLELGADVNKPMAQSSETALFRASDVFVIEQIVNAGARMDVMNDEGLTPVRAAAIDGKKQAYCWMVAANGGQEPTGRFYGMPREYKDTPLQEIVENLRSGDSDKQDMAICELVCRGESVLPEVLDQLQTEEDFGLLCYLSMAIGTKAEPAIPFIRKHLSHREYIVGASTALMNIHPNLSMQFKELTPDEEKLATEISNALFRFIFERNRLDGDQNIDSGFCRSLLERIGEPGKPYIQKLDSRAIP